MPHVGAHKFGFAAEAAQFSGKLLAFILVSTRNNDSRSISCEGLGRRATDACQCAGDPGHRGSGRVRRVERRGERDARPRVENGGACVVGGRESNNTRQLVETCRAAGKRAFHVERAEELKPEWFAKIRIVGLSAGTSGDWLSA